MLKVKSLPYTAAEKAVILEEVRAYPTNLSEAFKEAASRLPNRTQAAISAYWYHSLKKGADLGVTVGSSEGFSQNVKNEMRVDGVMPDQRLQSFVFLTKQLLALSKPDRKALLAFVDSIAPK